jgi:hypothetical protein
MKMKVAVSGTFERQVETQQAVQSPCSAHCIYKPIDGAASMPFKRLHSNGFEVFVYLESTQREWWLVRVKSGANGERSTVLGLKTTLDMAQVLGDSIARVDHLCNDKCEDWKAVVA